MLFEILDVLKTCAVRKCSQYGWRQNNPGVFYEHRSPPQTEIFYSLTPSYVPYVYWCYVIITHLFRSGICDATSSLPDYSVRAFSDETSSLPDYSVRALFWQIEIWSGIYTVYFNCKYFTSLYFIFARAIRMPPRDFASKSLRGQ